MEEGWAGSGRVCISVGVFFIKMLWEEVASPASVFVAPELEARALCQGEGEGILAGEAFRGLSRVCGHRPWLWPLPTEVPRLWQGEDGAGDFGQCGFDLGHPYTKTRCPF